MTGSTTTAMCTSFKQEILSAGHCFNATLTTTTISAASSATSVSSVSSMVGIAVGMTVTGTGIGANTVVARITSTSALTLSVPTTAIITAGAVTFTGDIFNFALILPNPTGTYTAATANYSTIGSDEVPNGSGYTTTGQALTNTTAVTGSTTAFINFNNPSWTSATFSTQGGMIYNTSIRDGNSSGSGGGGRACAVFDFGGVQEVSSGTFTILMPAANSVSAILRIA